MRRTEPEPDYLLWGLLTLSFGVAGALVQRLLMPRYSFLECCSEIAAGKATATEFLMAVATAVFLLAVAAAAGWFAQRLADAYGLRLTGRPASPEAADYDDAHPSPAANPPDASDPTPSRRWLWWLRTGVIVALGVTAFTVLAWLVLLRLGGFHI